MLHHLSKDLLSSLPTMDLDTLASHNGGGAEPGPYVAVLGLVYDMSESANFYGPGGNYGATFVSLSGIVLLGAMGTGGGGLTLICLDAQRCSPGATPPSTSV